MLYNDAYNSIRMPWRPRWRRSNWPPRPHVESWSGRHAGTRRRCGALRAGRGPAHGLRGGRQSTWWCSWADDGQLRAPALERIRQPRRRVEQLDELTVLSIASLAADGDSLLVKGSRSMKLERMDAIRARVDVETGALAESVWLT